ncbi:MAG: SpoIID/LytB domain-containing protein [Eubacteriales bacterium]|nr:SpoIID/LytB domain-containing protein [Christensenellaceae bacterium]MEA5066605.1 SpoIID/LytB domain-containing protein [Eubacteriales bacterium]
MKRLIRPAALALALTLSLTAGARAFWPFSAAPTPTPAPVFAPAPAVSPSPRPTEESALLRVLLKSLGRPVALGLTLSGSYTVENDRGFRFARDAEVKVAIDGDDLLLNCGALTLNMGPSFTLTRHAVKDGADNGIRIHETGRETLYPGDLTLENEAGAIRATAALDIEDYLLGVVPYEMSDSFPIEALKAQAVAARTYAMSRKHPGRAYDVVDTTADQVFKGVNPKHENAALAVSETRGVVGRYRDQYATCYFTASNGGQTALPDQLWGGAGDYGWLTVRDDPYDLENPSSPVKSLTLPADPAKLGRDLRAKLRAGLTEQLSALGYSDEIGDIRLIALVSAEPTDPMFGPGNRMFRKIRVGMTVEGKLLYGPGPTPDARMQPLNRVETVGKTLYTELDFYKDLKPNYGLKISGSDCEIASVVKLVGDRAAREGEAPDAFRIESRRFGHGVGMSQRGAQQMAGAHGKKWQDILGFYYPGMTLVAEQYVRAPLTELEALSASLGKARPRPTPKPTPAPLPALKDGESYARVTLGSKGSTLNVRDQAATTGKLLGTLDNAQRVIVVEELPSGWARIQTAELSGYASMDYLTIE